MVECRHWDCFYKQGSSSGMTNCGYLLMTGEKRDCPAGDCDKYISCKEAKRFGMKKSESGWPPKKEPAEKKEEAPKQKQGRGRPCILPENFDEVTQRFLAGELSHYAAAQECGMKPSTFWYHAKKRKKSNSGGRDNGKQN